MNSILAFPAENLYDKKLKKRENKEEKQVKKILCIEK